MPRSRSGRFWPRAITALACLCAAGGVVSGQMSFEDEPAMGEGVTLLGATRVVASWDFEGEDDRLFEIPPGWFRSVHDPSSDPPTYRPGFPPYNLAGVERSPSGRGYAMRVPTDGGSASLMLARGRVVAMPGSDYMLSARVRTESLEHARARIGIRFVDGTLAPIDGAGAMSEAVRSEGGWTTVRVRLEGHEQAAFVQIELQLAQPLVLDPTGVREHEVRSEDFSGAAWFDDVFVYQVPRIDFCAMHEQNVVVMPEKPELSLMVQDFTGETLVADARVYDVAGRLVAEHRMVDGGATGAGSSSIVAWTPDLPAFGWYRAVVLLKNEDGIVGQRACDLVWLREGPERDAEDRAAFGVSLGEADELGGLDEVTTLLEHLKSGSVWLGVWEKADGRGSSAWGEEESERVRRLVERLVDRRDVLTLVLSATPRELADAARTDVEDVLGVFLDEAEAGVSSLAPLLSRFSESASSWHLGPLGSERSSGMARLDDAVSSALEEMGRLAPRPMLSLPWSATDRVRPLAPDVRSPTVRVPVWATASGVAEIVRGWREQGVTPTLVFPVASEERYGVDAGVRRLVRLAIAGWEAGLGWSGGRSEGGAMVIEKPWRRAIDGRGGAMPTPSYAVWRTLSEELSGRRPVAELFVGEGARAIVGDGGVEGSGVIVAWNEWGRPEEAQVRALLGYGPVTVRDHFGNEETVYPVRGEHVIPLGPTPVFISGIDTELVRFRAGLKLDPGFLESRAQRHSVSLTIENPYPESIQVAVRFASPEGWDFGPRVVRTSVRGNGRATVPVEIALGVGETSGLREVRAEVALTTAGGEQPVQRVPLFMELGMKDLRVSPSYRYVTGPDGAVTGVVVSLLIANTGDREVPLQAFAFAPGFAAREALIPSLAPGQAIVRRFSFNNAGALVGDRVRAGIREINGNGRLNYWVELR